MPNDLDFDQNGVQNSITVTATPEMGASIGLTLTPGTLAAAENDGSRATTLDDLSVGDTVFTVTVVAADGTTQQLYTVTVTRAASDDATLSALTLTASHLILSSTRTPRSTPATATWPTMSKAPPSRRRRRLGTLPKWPFRRDADADVPMTKVDLDVGETTITVTVTAEDESTQSYTVTVTRAALGISSDSTLETLTLSGITDASPNNLLVPAFSETTTAYEASVEKYVTSTTVMAMAMDARGQRGNYAG